MDDEVTLKTDWHVGDQPNAPFTDDDPGTVVTGSAIGWPGYDGDPPEPVVEKTTAREVVYFCLGLVAGASFLWTALAWAEMLRP